MVEEDPDKETYYDLGNDGPVPVRIMEAGREGLG